MTINENITSNTLVYDVNDVNTGSDTDAENDALNYSITDSNSSGAFVIDSSTGEISVNNAALLDFEDNSQFVLSVVAQDGVRQDAALVTINLNDIIEAPDLQPIPIEDFNIEQSQFVEQLIRHQMDRILPVLVSNNLFVLIDGMVEDIDLDEDTIVHLELFAGAVSFTISFAYLYWVSKSFALASSIATVTSMSRSFDPLSIIKHARRKKAIDEDEVDQLFD